MHVLPAMIVACSIVAFPATARADVSPPPPARAAESLPRNCTLGEWLALKHAVARYCARRKDDDCAWARRNLEMQFCDGEQPDPERCADSHMVRELPDRCTLEARAPGGTWRVRVQPDCWSWELTAVRRARGWRVVDFAISVGGCD